MASVMSPVLILSWSLLSNFLKASSAAENKPKVLDDNNNNNN